MAPRDLYLSIGYTPLGQSCTVKKAYSYTDASRAVRRHKRRFVCEDMRAYWCRHHLVWHIGHGNKHRLADMRLREHISWFEDLSGRN